MQTANIYKFTIPANATYRLLVAGTYFKTLAAFGSFDVRSDAIDLKGLAVGQGMRNTPFDYLTFTDRSGSNNNLSIILAGDDFVDGITGTITVAGTVLPTAAIFTSSNVTVTNSSQALAAANPLRQYLLIQNRDSTGEIYLNFGAAATTSNGIKISPGGNFEPAAVPIQSLNFIGSIASNANVLIVQG